MKYKKNEKWGMCVIQWAVTVILEDYRLQETL